MKERWKVEQTVRRRNASEEIGWGGWKPKEGEWECTFYRMRNSADLIKCCCCRGDDPLGSWSVLKWARAGSSVWTGASTGVHCSSALGLVQLGACRKEGQLGWCLAVTHVCRRPCALLPKWILFYALAFNFDIQCITNILKYAKWQHEWRIFFLCWTAFEDSDASHHREASFQTGSWHYHIASRCCRCAAASYNLLVHSEVF